MGRMGLSFRQWFVILTQYMGVEDFCVSPEHGSGDDFWVGWDSIFVNDLWFSRSLSAMRIWASAEEMGSVDDLWVGWDSVFVNDLWF